MSLTETGSWVPLRIQSGFLSLGSGPPCTVSCVCFSLGLAPLILALPENNCRRLLSVFLLIPTAKQMEVGVRRECKA